jgi:hypothetical protein
LTVIELVQVRRMTSQHEIDRQNDAKLLTPFLLMALVVVVGVLFEELAPHLLAAI